MRKSPSAALLVGFIWITSNSFATEIRIPLQAASGVQLGQGFDIETMEWREMCAGGREQVSSPTKATVESSTSLSKGVSLETVNGTLRAGVSLLGGLGELKAKASYFRSWMSAETSSSTMFHLSFGSGYWNLQEARPLHPLTPAATFRKKCGTHLVTRLEIKNELFLLMRYVSSQEEWLQKVRWKVKAKGFWGLSKKSWTKEEIAEAADAETHLKLGSLTKGYFSKILSSRLGTEEMNEATCKFPDMEPCERLYDLLSQAYSYAREEAVKIQDGTLLMDKDLVTAAVLLPYDETGHLFYGAPPSKDSYKKIVRLNRLRSELFDLESLESDLVLAGESLSASDQAKISDIRAEIKKCEKENTCI